MSRNESKPETIEEQLGLSHIIKFIKTSIEFPAHQQAFVLYFYILIIIIIIMIIIIIIMMMIKIVIVIIIYRG